MAGYLGDDFDPLQPEDSDSVKYGASWIRDLKSRLKLFCSRLFNLDTGQLKDNVIEHRSLVPVPGLVEGTYNRVKVGTKGLVLAASNSTEQQTAAYYRATFTHEGRYYVDTDGLPTVNLDGTVDAIHLGSGVYTGTGAPFSPSPGYAVTADFTHFSFKPPAGVRRVKATLVGGGGGAYFAGSVSDPGSADWYGGGGGELAEAIFSLDGSGEQALTIVVGGPGVSGDAGTGTGSMRDGGPSRVALSDSVYVDAGPGQRAGTTTGGGSLSGFGTDDVLGILRSRGTAGALKAGGLPGSHAISMGSGGAAGVDPGPGVVILEWVR